MKRNKLFIAGMSVLLAVSFSGCSKKSASSVAEEEKPETIFAVNAYISASKSNRVGTLLQLGVSLV